MQPKNSIEVTDLLREREEAFVTVWKCEQAIHSFLGVDYPFPPPPDLPSRRKSKPSAKRNLLSKTGTGVEEMALAVRALKAPLENAYRIVYEFNGKQSTSFQVERGLVSQLIGIRTEDFQVLSIETVTFRDLEDWTAVELVYSKQ